VFKHLGSRPGQFGDGALLVAVEAYGTTELELLLTGITIDDGVLYAGREVP
jgi:hypothetical protein